MTPKQIEKKYHSLLARRKQLEKDLEDFKQSVEDICHHPEKFTYSWLEDRDDGYGKWWQETINTCLICGKRI